MFVTKYTILIYCIISIITQNIYITYVMVYHLSVTNKLNITKHVNMHSILSHIFNDIFTQSLNKMHTFIT